MALPFPEYDRLDGLAMADLVRRGEVSPIELVEAALARVAERNPALNAIVRPLGGMAREMANQVAARMSVAMPAAMPFAGVPMAIKDLLADIAGVPTSFGNRRLKDLVMPADSELVARYRRAGAVFIGRSNTPEFGLTPYTESEALGVAHNPWNVRRTTGGSSGGAGAAVAARIVPMAHGGDGGGSIRIPASCNGVFGLKPSRGRMPTGPIYGDSWRGFVQEHVLTISVRDSAAMLDATAGEDVGTPVAAPRQERPYLEEVTREGAPLRVAITATPLFGTMPRSDVHPDCRAALADAAQLIASLGHTVEEATPVLDGGTLARAFLTIVAGECRADIEWLGTRLGRSARMDDVEPATWALGLVGRSFSAGDYATAARVLQMAGRTVGRFFETYDVLVTPTLAAPPFVIGALQPSTVEQAALSVVGRLGLGRALRAAGMLDDIVNKVYAFMPYTALFNVTGQPAMSVPLYWNSEGLPIGTQIVGRFGDEGTLFRLAGQLERARAWRERMPGVVTG